MPNPDSRIGGGGIQEILPTTEKMQSFKLKAMTNPKEPDLYTKRQQESYKDLETRKLQKNT